MIKKYIAIGALGLALAGVESNLEITQTKAATNEIKKIDNLCQGKEFNLTGYVVGIHKNSKIIEVAGVETKEEAIEFSEKRNDFIKLVSENKFILFKNKADQKYEVGEQVKVSANKTERINHFLKSAIDPVVTKLIDKKKQTQNGQHFIWEKFKLTYDGQEVFNVTYGDNGQLR